MTYYSKLKDTEPLVLYKVFKRLFTFLDFLKFSKIRSGTRIKVNDYNFDITMWLSFLVLNNSTFKPPTKKKAKVFHFSIIYYTYISIH